nr:hypothetical protein [Tanacetum cinerariifolium]
MSRCVNWNAVTQIFTSKLSSWKDKLLSVGGRFLLFKAVLGNLPTYFMSIYLMHVSIRSKLESMRSKFFRGVDLNESKMSWVKWEKCLRKHSAWGSILSLINCLKDKGIDLISICFCKIGNGDTTRFWEDIWCGNAPLRIQFPRVFYLDTDRNCSIANRVSSSNFNWSNVLRRDPRGGVESSQFEAFKLAIGNVVLTHQPNSWQWSPDVAVGYSMSLARALVDF